MLQPTRDGRKKTAPFELEIAHFAQEVYVFGGKVFGGGVEEYWFDVEADLILEEVTVSSEVFAGAADGDDGADGCGDGGCVVGLWVWTEGLGEPSEVAPWDDDGR